MKLEELKKVGIVKGKDGVYFFPFVSEGVKIEYDILLSTILREKVVNIPWEGIKKHIEDDTDKPFKVADDLEEWDSEKNQYIQVYISRDGLEAYLDISFPSESDLDITYEDIIFKVYEAGVQYNIDYEKLKKIGRNKIFLEREIIAEGKPPIIGEEAQIVIEVDTEISSEPLILEDGSVDFRQINLLKTVEKDQLLAVKIAATKGEDGITVRNEIIDSTGKDKPLPRGKNTYISDDGLSLYASVSGRIIRDRNKLNVENILAIHGDVDYSVGNIEFVGDVAVSGDVLSGFKVQTHGDIRIKGVVEAAEIISLEGNVVIGRGIVGQEKARILAKKDVRADFINEAYIEAGNDVEVGEYIMNSIVNAENDVKAVDGRGSIIGGKTYAEKSIEAKTIGSSNNIRTEIRVGGKVEKELYEQMLILERDEENLKRAQSTIQKEIKFIEVLKKKLPKFPEKKAKELKDLIGKLKKVEEKLAEVVKKKEELGENMSSSVDQAKRRIIATTIHRGVLLGIDNSRFLTEYTYKYCNIYMKEGEMKFNYKTRFL